MTRRLNLGAGHAIIGDALNVDLTRHRPGIDLAVDLNNLPWPWNDSSWDHIVAKAVFEHLRLSLLEAMDECWRIIAPAGVLELKLPYWRSEVSYNDPSHRYVVGLGVFDQFDPSTARGDYYSFYTERKWRKRRVFLNKGGTSVYAVLDVIKAAAPAAEKGERSREAEPGSGGPADGDLRQPQPAEAPA